MSKNSSHKSQTLLSSYNSIHIICSDGILLDPINHFIENLPRDKKIFLWIINRSLKISFLNVISKIEKINLFSPNKLNSRVFKNVHLKTCLIKDFKGLFKKHLNESSLKLYLVSPESLDIDIQNNIGDFIATDIDFSNLSFFSLEETLNKKDFKEITIISSIKERSIIKMKHGLTSFFLNNKEKIEYAIFDYLWCVISSSKKMNAVNPARYTLMATIDPIKFINIKLTYYLMQIIKLKVKKRTLFLIESFFKIDSLSESWSVGYHNHKTGEVLNLPNSFNYHLADPFIFKHRGTNYCFVEKFNFNSNGEIHVYDLDRNSYLGLALKEDYHLSYPFVFRHKGKIYMLPETSNNNDIRLYESKNFPLEWELSSVIIKKIKAADSMIFYDEPNCSWLLLSNITSSVVDNDFHSLKAFASNSLTGPYSEIEGGHVVNDSTVGRNGGFLQNKESLFRVSQYFGHNCYGKSITIHKIDNLSTKKYSEQECICKEVDFLKYYAMKLAKGYKVIGFHHVNNNDDYTVFDFKIKPKISKVISVSKRKMPWI